MTVARHTSRKSKSNHFSILKKINSAKLHEEKGNRITTNRNDKGLESLKLEDFTNEILANKPKHAPDVAKWYAKGGKISIMDGVWTYHDWEGHSVSYPDGYPDFKSAGMVKQEVSIGSFQSYDKDFAEADRLAPNGPKADDSTWHHHQDGTTMQEIDKVLHRRFTHIGGMSGARK